MAHSCKTAHLMPDDHLSNNSPASDFDSQKLTRRSIRSFVIRNGRTTPAQTEALHRLMPEFGIDFTETPIDLASHFGRKASTCLEIGFGNGDVLINMAHTQPEINVLGVEVHNAGVGHALLAIEQHQATNVRLIQHDAMEVLDSMLPESCLDKVLLLFPDPWHKKRHHKRRIVQPEFLTSVARVLRRDGILHCATDWADYGEWMIEHLEADTRFSNVAGPGLPSERPQWRPVTRFEKRGHRLGHAVVDLIYKKV